MNVDQAWLQVCREKAAELTTGSHKMHGHFTEGRSQGVCECGTEFIANSSAELCAMHDAHALATPAQNG
jgi:hypothetical protein